LLLGVAAVAVAIAVIVLALAASGVLRLGSTSTGNPTYETFSQATSVAQSRSSSVAGGPWFAFGGVAVVTRAAVLEPVTNVSGALKTAGCTADWIGGMPANVAVPGTPASVALGASAYWAFVLKNASNGILLETIASGSADAVATLGGTNCTAAASYLDSFGSGMQDSPTIIAAANAAGGAAFLVAHPNATQAWAVTGGATFSIISTSPEWLVEYTSCALPAAEDEEGAVFNATVGGTSGVVTAHTNGTVDCALTAAVAPTLGVPTPFAAVLLRKAI
jgi:hypothetical protein